LTDKKFFAAWKADLQDEKRWRTYYARYLVESRKEKGGVEPGVAAYDVPPVPDIDTEWLHVEMMRIARQLDPHMGPALKKLRQYADQSDGALILGALSNTSIFPPEHPLYDATTTDGKASKGLDGIFDVFVSSAYVGMRKPAEDIYKYAMTRLHEYVKTRWLDRSVRGEDIVFIDDIGYNLKTAKNLGMRTIKVNLGRADLAVKELEKVTGLDLSSDKAKL
jgi:FMN phosphatase YigB (HAD superfamily)